ncbi:hypothetical protein GIB67_009563 [Kingdonia uniflora]|uniref:AAA ATPase AAA+ lid domain-containing protein n=1 Tax=Kingdonia uniflora TaxID=39325 RepID=A0A7J7NWQ5_9MAGN|nr:hypothetical protein GIB67_009563 [Kingdonia uniflora]
MRGEMMARFMPSTYEEGSFAKLQTLQQARSQSVDDHTSNFYMLSSRVVLSKFEVERVSSFRLGLTKRIQDEMVLFSSQSLSEIFEMARRVEVKLKPSGYSSFTAPSTVLYVPPPDFEGRYEILCVHTRTMKISEDVDLKHVAEETDLFTGAELEGLCREAGMVALREDISATKVCNRHFQTVTGSLKPALTRKEVNVYASFMKNPSRGSKTKQEINYKDNLMSSLKFGFVSAALVYAAFYLGFRLYDSIILF